MTLTDERFAKLNVKFWQNQKAHELSKQNPHALNIWTFALTYCSDNYTDGIFTDFIVKQFLGAEEKDIEALLEANFIELVDTGKYKIHDFEQYQVSVNDAQDIRSKFVEAGRRGAMKRWGKKHKDVSQSETEKTESDSELDSSDSTYDSPHVAPNNPYIADKDIDIDKDIDTKKENIKRKKSETGKTEPDPQSESTQETSHTELTPTQDSEPSAELTAYPKHNPQQFADLTTRLKAIYPVARFDLETSHNQNLLEAYWFKVEQHAHKAGAVDPFSWLVSQTLDYVNATEPKYVKRFSKYFMEETYCQDWHNAERPMSRSEANLKHNLTYIRHLAELEAQGINPFAKEATV